MAHKAVFFDRDGVLNIDKAYLYKIDELEWIEGALEGNNLFNTVRVPCFCRD